MQAPPVTEELRLLLQEFQHELDGGLANEPFTDSSYWHCVELKFTLRCLHVAAFKSFETALLLGHGRGIIHAKPAREAQARLTEVSDLMQQVEKLESARLDATAAAGAVLPLMTRVQQKMGLTAAQLEMFQLLTLMQTARTRIWASQTQAYQEFGQSKSMFTDLCAIAREELELFYDDENQYIKEGTILVDSSYDNEKTPRMTREVASALRGNKISVQDRLKLAGTEILALSRQDQAQLTSLDMEPAAAAAEGEAAGIKLSVATEASNAARHDAKTADPRALQELLAGVESLVAASESQIAALDDELELDDEALLAEMDEQVERKIGRGRSMEGLEDDEAMSKPYTTELQFLEDQFQMVTAQIKLSREKFKNEMREVLGDNDVPSWERDQRGKRTNIREFETKLKLMQTQIAMRQEVTSKVGLRAPRLVQLCERLGLDGFERSVIVLLIGNTVSPLMAEILKNFRESGASSHSPPDTCQVKLLLHAFCTTCEEQIEHRKYFYKSSRLVKTGLVRLGRYSIPGIDQDLTSQIAVLDRRMLDWIVGLDTEINEVVEGTNLYTPSVELSSVVLPEEQKEQIMSAVDSFSVFQRYQHSQGLLDPVDHVTHSGSHDTLSLVFMFSGPSGTGKTLTVNAIATHLEKRVLLVNFNAMSKQLSGASGGPAVQSLFREANMHDALIFFDECEALFSQRSRGGSHEMTELLTEIERHRGMIFMATNRPFDLDEAMHRRITATFTFRSPSWLERKAIWSLHTTSRPGIFLDPLIDWHEIALRYELAGGFIKNAVMSALLNAVARDGPEHPVITQSDIEHGCALQMRGSLKMKAFRNRVVPRVGMDALVLADDVRAKLLSVVDLEKARGVLMSQWGFDRQMRSEQSTTIMMWGATGTGKTVSAEAIGFELGRPLKVLSLSELMAPSAYGADEKENGTVQMVFKDAALMSAMIVIEGFEAVLNPSARHHGVSGMSLDQLLFEMCRYRGVVVVVVSAQSPFAHVCHTIDPDLLRKFKLLVEFEQPTPAMRAQLWRKMIPSKAPLSGDVDFYRLGQDFEFNGGHIARVAYRAAARAAVRRPPAQQAAGGAAAAGREAEDRTPEHAAAPMIQMADLMEAAADEEAKTQGDLAKLVNQWFL